MPTTNGGRGRSRKGAEETKASADAQSKGRGGEKPRRGRRPGSGRKAQATAAAAAPARRKGGRPAAAEKAAPAAKKGQPIPASTRGVSLPHTLADVSRAVNVSATTIKYYLSHLPRLIEFEGSGRKRRFSDRAVQMLSDVRRMLSDENKSLNQIRHELESKSHGGGHHHAEAAPARKESGNGGRPAKAAAHAHKGNGGSLEDLVGTLISEVRSMRGEIDKLRKTRWVPHD